MSVSIVRSKLENVKDQIDLLLKQINYSPQKKQVLIKPNIVAPVPAERGVITHPSVVAATIEFLLDHNCEVVIAESSSVAQNTSAVFQMTGYSEIGKKYGIDLINLNEAPRVKKEWKFGFIELPEIIFSHEYINIAKMKTHIGTRVTLGLKNQKGLIKHSDKKKFHLYYNLDEAVLELSKVVSPSLTIIDGIIALEGDGPGGAGKPVDMQVLLAGTEVLEVDNIASQVMGFQPGEIEHIPKIDNIDIIGIPLQEIKRDFIQAKRDQLILDNINYYSFHGCSGCTERLAGGLKRADKTNFSFPINVLAGIDPKIPNNDYPSICFGNCTKTFALKNSLHHISGCPPDMEDVAKIPALLNLNQ